MSEEAGRISEPRSRFYEQSAKLGSRWWLDSRQGAVARQQNIARELRFSLEQWRDATQNMSGAVKTRLIELRVPQPVVDETIAGAERGIASVQPLFELRFAQLDDLDRLFQLLASAPWTTTAGRVTFQSAKDQSAFDALVASIDQTEVKIEAVNAQLKSQRSR
ncbi:MAG TPA: hypothetical protein VK157_10840 [Phycisphaerales bacterium]|nr:hypothetical protein [Phycisphaerales bacterium]